MSSPTMAPPGCCYVLAAACSVPGVDKTVYVLQPQLGRFGDLPQAIGAQARLQQPNLVPVLLPPASVLVEDS